MDVPGGGRYNATKKGIAAFTNELFLVLLNASKALSNWQKSL